MLPALRSRRAWICFLLVIIALGILSRVFHTGWIVLDKYLGDALYAAMMYAILRLASRSPNVVWWAAILMFAIECFQLTEIAAHMLSSPHWIVRICARLMGTSFSWVDLLTYAVGIGGIYLCDGTSRPAVEHQAVPAER